MNLHTGGLVSADGDEQAVLLCGLELTAL